MEIIHLQTVDSTNNYAKQNIKKYPDKTVIITDVQTAGRGRFTRAWVDLGCENLFLTIILKPSDKLEEKFSNLTQYLSVKLAETLEQYGVKPQIKWPNDVLVNGKKIAGILSEAVFEGRNFEGIVLGVGVNLNAEQKIVESIPNKLATSLNLEINRHVNKNEFSQKLLGNFFKDYQTFLDKGFSAIKSKYRDKLALLNQNITIKILEKEVSGVFMQIDDSGALILKTNNGLEKIYIGDIL